MAKDAIIYSVRIDDCDSGAEGSDIVAGINFVRSNYSGASIINISYTTSATSIKDAIEDAIDDGIVVVIGAGNDDVGACTLAGNTAIGVISVAATDFYDDRASFSNYGSCVDIFAPGVGVPTTVGSKSGTSFAAPLYSGTAALHLERWPNDSPHDVNEAVRGSASQVNITDDLGSPELILYTRGPRLTVEWEGPTQVRPSDSCSYSGSAEGGRPPYTYLYSGFLSGSGPNIVGNSGSTAQLTLDVWDSDNRHASFSEWVIVDSGNPDPGCLE